MKIKQSSQQLIGGLLFLVLPFLTECYKSLTNESLRHLARMTDTDRLSVAGELMKPLLVERVSGTTANKQVREYIVEHFNKLGWHVELDSFINETPLGNTSFTNIIVTQNPEKPSRLVLAAHYDSMYSPDFEFIGATDSAIPCGLLMNIAETLDPILSDASSSHRQPDKTLQIIFFDGEEAVRAWSPTDSIYGARHLATKWESSLVSHPKKVYKNKLDQIEVMVLLDLLGVANTQFPNYYRSTSWLYDKLMSLESRLIDLSIFHTKSAKTNEALISLFNPNSFLTYRGEAIGDDHVPFLTRGVNVLHLITHPFPHVWHNRLDNADCIDSAVVENLAVLFRAFVAEYLELDLLPHNEL
ncbi:MAG: hypothetical protein EXX96DRAFT_564765 [Benjaminiella poitrasii]|nr:MAG: hypothetical protein EXX96DRAFT_564765 [Benjaminiella poitrasii]